MKKGQIFKFHPNSQYDNDLDLKGHITNIKHVVKRFDDVTWMESVSASGKEI